ncbi:TPA: Rrf2 family transcriptional regulator [Streptococcus suis]|uniref:Rrf2 family transcriptional regulator n=1 Tax=Streptococcus suis TaxID=1307 RepID=UPI001146B01B|nr:Rrf2 family transcriptional regulator [Streptococcus suis]TQE79764.1 Rrf2 family transcriptional regulator [Streptococcus suis]HEM4634470.1 Rrf2 family transcriptional regulator [Streptococcus suis]HEM5983240.1 Rrf2 family transcriptional regulator [Streptococcus suis]HEM6186736.1 Rrf2 family transcriptional regulator [Streptococcus suis]HEM6193238.1 Rrf2 family transcriptional regulator [Streptococcus suis]
MQISSRFTIASHILVLLALEGEKEKQTSTSIAGSVGVNPVIIRNILSQLKEAGLVEVARGVGGARLAQAPDQITLLYVYQAVELFGEKGQLFAFHEQPNPNCQVGRNIHPLLDSRLENAQSAMENELAKTRLADLLAEL